MNKWTHPRRFAYGILSHFIVFSKTCEFRKHKSFHLLIFLNLPVKLLPIRQRVTLTKNKISKKFNKLRESLEIHNTIANKNINPTQIKATNSKQNTTNQQLPSTETQKKPIISIHSPIHQKKAMTYQKYRQLFTMNTNSIQRIPRIFCTPPTLHFDQTISTLHFRDSDLKATNKTR